MALGRKRAGGEEILAAEVVAPDGGFAGGYPGFTPDDFTVEPTRAPKERRKKSRAASKETEAEPFDAFEDTSAAVSLEGTSPLTQFDFLENRWVYVRQVRRLRIITSGTSFVLILAVLLAGLLAHLGATSANDQTRKSQAAFVAANQELGQVAAVGGHSSDEITTHLTARRGDILVAVGMDADIARVAEAVRANLPAGMTLQSVGLTQGSAPAAAPATPGAPPAAAPLAVTIVVQGRGIGSVIAWYDAVKRLQDTITNPTTQPSGNPQGTYSITTTATLTPSATGSRAATYAQELSLPGAAPATPASPATPGAPGAPGAPTPRSSP